MEWNIFTGNINIIVSLPGGKQPHECRGIIDKAIDEQIRKGKYIGRALGARPLGGTEDDILWWRTD